MKGISSLIVALLLALALQPSGHAQSTSVNVHGSVAIRPELQSTARSMSIVVNVRAAGTYALVAHKVIATPDAGGKDSTLKLANNPCYYNPSGCPFTAVMKVPHARARTCVVSVELQDSLYLRSEGREGCNRILGYYTGQPPKKLSAKPQPAKPQVIAIDKNHKTYNIHLVID